ncbi:MAG: hypothetical protein E7081_07570 [Bacteroidales bacterium]|nr:hypothetical protein [Bacteroidales bacterium]
MMEDSAEVALAILQDSIDSASLSTERGRAIYALLLSQALDKNYIDIASDSIIAPAVKYFASGEEPLYAMLAHYYNAVIFFNANNLSASAIACMESEQYAKIINSNFQLAKIYALLSYIYNYTYNFEEELYYSNKSLEQFYITKDFKQINNAKIRLAESYNNVNDFKKSTNIYKEILTNTDKIDSLNILNALKGYCHALINQGKYLEAKKYIYSIKNKYNTPLSSIDYSNLGKIYIHLNMLDSAEFYLSKGENLSISCQDTIALNSGKYLLYLSKKDYKNALKFKQQQTIQQNNTTKIIWDQSVLKSQRNVISKKLDFLKLKSEKQHLYLTIAISMGITIALFLFALYYYMRHKRLMDKIKLNKLQNLLHDQRINSQYQIEQNQVLISQLEKQLSEYTLKNSHLRKDLELKKEELETVNKLIAQKIQQKQTQENIIKSSNTYIKLQQKLSLEYSAISETEWLEIINLVNKFYPNFIERLNEFCKISDIELHVCILIKILFSPTEIAFLLNKSKTGVSSIRSRLYKKMFHRVGTSKEFDDFILAL